MIQRDSFMKIRRNAPDVIASACAMFMLCFIPLAFNDAFFDINRHKVSLVIKWIPVFCIVMAVALLADPKRKQRFFCKRGLWIQTCMLLMMGACIISCARAGFTESVLIGNEGRYCGLYFMLCCGAAFFVISNGRVSFKALMPLMTVCAALCAVLGFANAIGYDPLGFYARIKKGQEPTFLSTIGNFDFFGAFLVMMLAPAGAQFVFGEKKAMRLLGGGCAVAIVFGATASRTECAFVGMHMVCYLLISLSGDHFVKMGRAFLLWAICFLSLPITYPLLEKSIYNPYIDGLPKLLFKQHIGECMAILLIALAVVCAILNSRGVRAPGRRWLLKRMLVLFAAGMVAASTALVYFSVFDINTKLGSAENFLRFNDSWGSLRGFVYTRSLRAFRDYEAMDKLFGAGMELTKSVLTPYFDDPKMLRHGIFNDPHCQPLQMLLTCGVTGMLCFSALYVAVLALLFRHAGEDPVSCGLLCAIWSYGLIMLINVTQPILISTYFTICALSVSYLRARASGGMVHES